MVDFIQPESMRKNLQPGSLVFVGQAKMETPRIRLFHYTADHLEEAEPATIEEALAFLDRGGITWINVDGLHDVSLFQTIQARLQIHPLLLEDILNTRARPKYEAHEGCLLAIMKFLHLDTESLGLEVEQVSVLLGPTWVFTFQEREGDFFQSVRERLRTAKGRVRRMGADYLAYALMDATVDSYYHVPEHYNEVIARVEESVLDDPQTRDLQTIYLLKRQIVLLEKALWPLREAVNELRREETDLVREATHPFLQDMYDHIIQLIDTVQSFRDMISSLQDLYLSTVSNRMNEVMKVLTIIATIFIPLTFIAGVYGMNFEFMPELKMKGAYFIALGVMIVVALGMVAFFKRKRWL